MANKRPTTYEIAKLAGVSQSTVSMILNNNQASKFSDQTIQKVRSVAAELGYDVSGRRAPRRVQTGNIAVLVPHLTNPYYSELLEAIETEAIKTGQTLITLNVHKNPKAELRQLELLLKLNVDGILFLYVPLNGQAVQDISNSVPVVMVSDKSESMDIDAVEMSGFKSGMVIAEHLIALGHRHAAFISTNLSSAIIRRHRFEAISQVFCPAEGRSVFLYTPEVSDPSLPLDSFTVTYDIGYALTHRVLREHPEVTALIGGNDQQSYGILDALYDRKARVPEDFSVCGFDDNHPSRFRNISLTTVDPFIAHKGKEAYSILLRKIHALYQQQPVLTVKIEYSPGLLVRGSTGPCRSALYADIAEDKEPGAGAEPALLSDPQSSPDNTI